MPTPRLSPPLLRQLQVFCESARHLSFKTAADALYLTPSAVSHQIRDLEKSLGVQLFERRVRAVHLTRKGEALYAETQPLLNELAGAITRITSNRSRRSLSVVVPPFFASELFVPRLASFYSLQPGIDIRLDTSVLRPDTHPSSADVSILLAVAEPTDVRAYELFTLRYVPACSPGRAQALPELSARALRGQTLVIHRARKDAWQRWAEVAGIGEIEPKNVIELDDMFSVVRAAERGVGIALLPTVLTASWFAAGRLVRVSPVELLTRDTYYMAHRHDDSMRPEIRALASWALTEFKK